MEKKKKIIIIVAGVIILVAIIAIILFFAIKGNNENGQASKLNAYYEKLQDSSTYSFSVSLDDKNNISYQKQSNKAYINTNYQGINSKYIIRDGNTYLLRDNDKVYYTYSNNETDLYMIEMILSDIKDNEVVTGKEKIENKNYYYEEFKGMSQFYFGDINNIGTEESNQTQEEIESKVKTRFYFNNNDLVYIKTIIDDNTQQLLKVDYSKKVDNNLVNVPSDYKEM